MSATSMNFNNYISYRDLMYFHHIDITNDYFFALTEGGQVYYGVSDDSEPSSIKWKLVNIDEKSLNLLH